MKLREKGKNGLQKHGKKLAFLLALTWGLLLIVLCFLPQSVYPEPKSQSTPGILQLGRLYFLLIPFNSLVNAGKVETLSDLGWIFLQNIGNIFLLYPLVLALLFLYPQWRQGKKVLLYSFGISLFIELTQLVLDAVWDVRRVFEVDDLWTNTLGGYLAYLSYQLLEKYLVETKKSLDK